MKTKLGKKQAVTHEQFVEVFRNVKQIVPRAELDALVDRTVEHVKKMCKGRRAAFAWSAGKDSIALQFVAEAAGVKECVLAMTHGLEYPAFLAWVTDHMPAELEVIATKQDLAWLTKNPEMLFPRDSKLDGKWFKIVQHTAQAQFYERRGLDVLLLGRRLGDGNFCGPKGDYIYESKGVVRYSPIAEWTHEHIFALIKYYDLALPPIYGWPRGFRVGTGSWPARQWTTSHDHGFSEVWTIDKDIVRQAARVLPQAREWMQQKGHT